MYQTLTADSRSVNLFLRGMRVPLEGWGKKHLPLASKYAVTPFLTFSFSVPFLWPVVFMKANSLRGF